MEKLFILKSINRINAINKKCLINILDYTSIFYLKKNLNYPTIPDTGKAQSIFERAIDVVLREDILQNISCSYR